MTTDQATRAGVIKYVVQQLYSTGGSWCDILTSFDQARATEYCRTERSLYKNIQFRLVQRIETVILVEAG